MKVILLQGVPNLGNKYDIKNVSDGYARNFLIPRNLVQVATTPAIQAIEKQKKQINQRKKIWKNILEKNLSILENQKIFIAKNANEKGHLFAGIHKDEISKILNEQKRIDIPVDIIELEQPIKEIGEHEIKIGNKKLKLEIINK